MKHYPDVSLQILKAMEAYDEDEIPMKTMLIPDLEDKVYYQHCRLLDEAGYIRAYIVRTSGLDFYWPRQITWSGYEFLETFENETLWQRAKDEAREQGVGLSLDILKRIGLKIAADLVGL